MKDELLTKNSSVDQRPKPGGISSGKGPRKDPSLNPSALLLQIQSSFDKGKKHEFFKAFESLVPSEMKKRDFSYKKLEFYLQIYFVVYISHPNINS